MTAVTKIIIKADSNASEWFIKSLAQTHTYDQLDEHVQYWCDRIDYWREEIAVADSLYSTGVYDLENWAAYRKKLDDGLQGCLLYKREYYLARQMKDGSIEFK